MSGPQINRKFSMSKDSATNNTKVTKNESAGSEFSESEVKDASKNPSTDPEKETESKIDTEYAEIPRSVRRLFQKRGKVSDIIVRDPPIDLENHPSGSSKSFKPISTEESIETKWKRFWESNREKFKQKLEERSLRNRSDDANIETDVIFHRRRSSSLLNLQDTSTKKIITERSRLSNEIESSKVSSSFHGSKDKIEAKNCDLRTTPVINQDSLKCKVKEDTVYCQNDAVKEEKHLNCLRNTGESNLLSGEDQEKRIQAEETSVDRSKDLDRSPRRWSSLENLQTKDCTGFTSSKSKNASTEKSKTKDKMTIGSLKSSLERKMGSVERMLEDHVERIIEENVEKHPWLLPIETWILDHCKHSSNDIFSDRRKTAVSKVERSKIEPGLAIKFTAAENEHDEPKIETKLENSGNTGSESTNLGSDTALSTSKSKKSENSQREEANPKASNGALELKDTRHHDLFDKLRDNVKEKMEDIHRYFQRTNRLADVNRRLKSQIWSSVVTIVLVEARNLLPMDIDGLSDPYVKFRLGTEKYKSKVVHKTLNPVWLEQFDLHLYEDPYLGQELEVTVWDRDKSHQDDLMGRTMIDLATLERETTHRLWRELEDGSGSIFLLLTISGTTASETISDLAAHEETPHEREQLYQRYSVMNTFQRIRDVGHLTVKVFRAQGLAAADLGGKSDPFCVLELVNSRLQTQTEYKTLAPNWQKIFTFNVKDINSVLEVTVYDEDRDHKVEFLGKVAIPLLRIRNGEKRWYALKDKKLRGRAKGNSPQILLEMTVRWNVLRACVRTLNPKEKKYMEPEIKFKRQVFLRNVLRLKAIIIIFIDIGKYIQSCWEWESKMRSIIALVFFVVVCYYFEPYMIPGAALLILLRYYLVAVITGAPLSHNTSSHFHDEGDDGPTTPGDDDDDDDDKDKEEKKSLKERLQAIQEVTQTVQNSIGYIASLCERVKNLFNFTVPYLSYLAIVLVILGAAILYFIPVRYLILAWGINKFFRKIIRPHSVPNNEVLDLISRVPDDDELLNYSDLEVIKHKF
ncbi:multiple C2 domain and transmembrane region protein isoform X2 [Nomia melanderi]|uniref:multiple C2 domain and transmembrane region protein isoform X2 n=1 Tax=Nomia melanderi TaxID=2448451 RepID=UPI001303FA80|nr:multiple C2 and transmembrane domain-containing protein isoform X2 [Nomia melanderi]